LLPDSLEERTMLDFVYLTLALGGFAVMATYAAVCNRL
jgi:hypothetical protein